EVGTAFFVVDAGALRVEVNGQAVNTLTRGDAFGGLALLYKSPRTATVRAVEAAGIWGTDHQSFHQALQDSAQGQHSANRRFLDSAQDGIFDGLSGHQKDVVCETLSADTVDAGSRVVTEGEASNAIYFVKAGELLVFTGGTVTAAGVLEGGK
ncbi:unnamed protein product, partial [Prorocentrum cordatum]